MNWRLSSVAASGLLFLCAVLGEGSDLVVDKSKFGMTQVQALVRLPEGSGEQELAALLKSAEQTNATVSVQGCRHSQGGHISSLGGLVFDLSTWNKMKLLPDDVLWVQAGATWKQVIEFVNKAGLSVGIMQSDYDFTVGGSISTNVHGWQANRPPIVDSIKSMRVMLADGRVVSASRDCNKDLFSAVVGGYGTLGIILDVELQLVPNVMYSLKEWVTMPPTFVASLRRHVFDNPKARMVFGRFRMDKEHFLQEIAVKMYEQLTEGRVVDGRLIGAGSQRAVNAVVNAMFAGTQNNGFVRKSRWWLEAHSGFSSIFGKIARNRLLYHSVDAYVTRDEKKTDLLQEYFIPFHGFEHFTRYLQSLKEEFGDYLLNVTVRHVEKDSESLLAYAKEDLLSFVMFFRGPRSALFDAKIGELAIKMTEKSLELGGSYYLPYRPYQTREQFQRAYPRWNEFKAIKQKYDPNGRFNNNFGARYLK